MEVIEENERLLNQHFRETISSKQTNRVYSVKRKSNLNSSTPLSIESCNLVKATQFKIEPQDCYSDYYSSIIDGF